MTNDKAEITLAEIKEKAIPQTDGTVQDVTHMRIKIQHYRWLIAIAESYPCRECKGSGKHIFHSGNVNIIGHCRSCNGTGKEYRG